MGNIEVREIGTSRKELKQFIYLPEAIHRSNEKWLPPIYTDEWDIYDHRKNKSFEYCEYARLMAFGDGKIIKRFRIFQKEI